ncbi:MAG: hypothetical protein O7H41_12965 [Planctomycetota bacterium]|nr:hypothetical protein [Planctomycetota bacterium]
MIDVLSIPSVVLVQGLLILGGVPSPTRNLADTAEDEATPPVVLVEDLKEEGKRLMVYLGVYVDEEGDAEPRLLKKSEEGENGPPFEIHKVVVGPDGSPLIPRMLGDAIEIDIEWGPYDEEGASNFKVRSKDDSLNLEQLKGDPFVLKFSTWALDQLGDTGLPQEHLFELDDTLLGSQEAAAKSQEGGALYEKTLWWTEHNRLEFVVRGASSDEADAQDVAADLKYDAHFKNWKVGESVYLNLDLEAKATLTIANTKSKRFHTFADGELSLELVYFYAINNSGLHLLSLAVQPASFEATQNFDVVNYAGTLRAEAWVPGSRLIARGVQSLIGTRSLEPMAPPIGVSAELVLVDNVQAPGGTSSQEKDELSRHRIDLEVIYLLPLIRELELYARGRWMYLLNTDSGEEATHRLLQFGIRYYTNEERTSAFEVIYTEGSVPPEFVEDETISAGWSLRF